MSPDRRRLLGVIVVLALAVPAWMLWRSSEPSLPLGGHPGASAGTSVSPGVRAALPVLGAPPERLEVEVARARNPEEGSLGVRAYFGAGTERVPAAGIRLRAGLVRGALADDGGPEATTDEEGAAEFAALPAGRYLVFTDRMLTPGELVTVVGGEQARLELELVGGIDVTGQVVDDAGAAVPGAVIEILPLDAESSAAVTTAGADGSYRLRAIPTDCAVGARAPGFAPSDWQLVRAIAGAAIKVRIVLRRGGGAVRGRVLDNLGLPVTRARLRFGPASHEFDVVEVAGGARGFRRGPVDVRAEDDGSFYAAPLVDGPQGVLVQAPGFGVWTGACVVVADAEVQLAVTLEPGVSCEGTVVDRDGRLAGGVEVVAVSQAVVARVRDVTRADGSFRLLGLTPGRVELRATDGDRGSARLVRQCAPGETFVWAARLEPGLALRGSVSTAAGKPVAGAVVLAFAPPAGERRDSWAREVRTDEDGRFAVAGCPADAEFEVSVVAGGRRLAFREHVDPRGGELEIEVAEPGRRSTHIIGTVLDDTGRSVAHAEITAVLQGATGHNICSPDPDTGRFSIGPTYAGWYGVRVEAAGYLAVDLGRSEVRDGATWDVGEIRLARGGRVVVRRGWQYDPAQPQPLVTLLDGNLAPCAVVEAEAPVWRSLPLRPGRHVLQVSGRGIAAQWLPVDVVEGGEEQVDIAIRPGQPCDFRVQLPGGTGGNEVKVRLQIRDAAALVFDGGLPAAGGNVRVLRIYLAQGRYGAAASAEGLAAQATFTVDDRAAAPPTVNLALARLPR